MASQIFAMGGGGFTGPRGGPSAMFRHILAATGKKYPKVCLVPTATGDKRETVADFVYGMNRLRAHPNFLSLYSVPTPDLEDWIMDFDAVYVSGGNTRNLLALWKAWGLDAVLKQACARGVILFGGSAGAICWFEQGNSDFIADEFNPLDALGWLPGSLCPHYGDEKDRRASYQGMVADGRLKPGYALSDRAVLHYVDGKLHEALLEWEEAGAYRVERGPDGTAVETKLPARLVG
ncbi:MAG: peptidase E [Planctomycetota bacterium]|nr:peptidase E [Planctomycetota bacterium]